MYDRRRLRVLFSILHLILSDDLLRLFLRLLDVGVLRYIQLRLQRMLRAHVRSVASSDPVASAQQ